MTLNSTATYIVAGSTSDDDVVDITESSSYCHCMHSKGAFDLGLLTECWHACGRLCTDYVAYGTSERQGCHCTLVPCSLSPSMSTSNRNLALQVMSMLQLMTMVHKWLQTECSVSNIVGHHNHLLCCASSHTLAHSRSPATLLVFNSMALLKQGKGCSEFSLHRPGCNTSVWSSMRLVPQHHHHHHQ